MLSDLQFRACTTGVFRLSIQSLPGSAFAPEQTFTASFSPSARTLAASGVSNSFAVLNGLVNAKGNATAAWFEYGLSTNFGSRVALSAVPASGRNSPVASPLAT